jgi:small-conductance mechanosensitive channel
MPDEPASESAPIAAMRDLCRTIADECRVTIHRLLLSIAAVLVASVVVLTAGVVTVALGVIALAHGIEDALHMLVRTTWVAEIMTGVVLILIPCALVAALRQRARMRSRSKA